MKGTVKFYNRKKNFGFILGEDGKEYFVHFSGIARGVHLNENTKVTFEVEESDRGPKAVNVNYDGPAPAYTPRSDKKPGKKDTESEDYDQEESDEEEQYEEY